MNLRPPASPAQLIQAAVTSHLKEPSLERHIRLQDWQGNVELQVHMLEHIRDLVVIIEKDPNVAHERAMVPAHQEFKGALIAALGLPNQDTIWDPLPL